MILLFIFFFFFNDTAPTEIYPLPLHDALPILSGARTAAWSPWPPVIYDGVFYFVVSRSAFRSLAGCSAAGRRSGCWRCDSAFWRSGAGAGAGEGVGRSARFCRVDGAAGRVPRRAPSLGVTWRPGLGR